MTMWRLASTFMILSLLGFGGGKAIVPQMYADAVVKYHWLTAAQFARFFAISKLAPGPTTLISALIGYPVAGFAGAIVAVLAMYLPAALLMYAVGKLWDRFHQHAWRDNLARAMAPIMVGLIWAGAAAVGQGALTNLPTYVIAAGFAALMLATRLSTPVLMACAGIAGALLLR
jgi:chromate transporter